MNVFCFRERDVYVGEMASEYVRTCVKMMETGDPQQLSSTLNDSIQRSAMHLAIARLMVLPNNYAISLLTVLTLGL